jgi:hypothetical protein
MRKISTTAKTLSAVLLLAIVALGLWVPAARAGICESALIECMNDEWNVTFGPFEGVYCILGYVFCKKYIEPIY